MEGISRDIFNVAIASDDDSSDKYSQVFSNKNLFQCYHNNRGYCSYRTKCRYQHYEQVCPKTVCREHECKKRHPVLCKFRENCKFHRKAICSFKHIAHTNDKNEKAKSENPNSDEAVDKLLEENRILVREVEDLKAKNKMLEAKLKRFVASMHDKEIELIDDKVSHETVEQTEEICMYVCEKCDFRTNSTAGLNTHISVKHTTKNLKNNTIKLFLCDHCNFASNFEEKLNNHTENNHNHDQQEERSTCEQCDFICETENDLKEHTESNHGYLSCDICDEFECEWDEIDALDTHKELFHEFKCNNCDYKTTTQKGLNIHRGTKHKNDVEVQAVKETYTCDKCWLTFSSKETLNKHKRGMHKATLTF